MQLIIILTSIFIAYQDFRYRAVHGVAFIILFLLLLTNALAHFDLIELLSHTLFNLSILLFQWLSLTLYFSIKSGRIISIMDKYIGWGDAVMFMVLSVFFPPVQFIIFLLSGFLISLMMGLLQKVLFPKKITLVPLAGWLSSVLFVLLVANYIHPQELIFSDYPLKLVLNAFNLL